MDIETFASAAEFVIAFIGATSLTITFAASNWFITIIAWWLSFQLGLFLSKVMIRSISACFGVGRRRTMGNITEMMQDVVNGVVGRDDTSEDEIRLNPQQSPTVVPLTVEGTSAFVCDGSCGAIIDRPFVCGNASCTDFMRPLRPNPVVFVCLKCQSSTPQGPRSCCGDLCHVYAVMNDGEKKPVLNVSQFPAVVPARDSGPHVPLIDQKTIPIVTDAPTMDTMWANRHVVFHNVRISGASRTHGYIAPHHVIVQPDQRLSISFDYSCNWQYSPNDYCPGCVIQWYVGMKEPRRDANQFCIDLIRGYHSGLRGRRENFEFTAPSFPGVYYITTAFSLDYSFVPVGFENSPKNSIAVVQVAYFDKWRPQNHPLLQKEDRLSIETFFKLAGASRNHSHRTATAKDCPCQLGTLDGPIYSKIFSYLGPYRD